MNKIHPGAIVKESLIDSTGLTVTEAARRLGVTRMTLSNLINEHSRISPEMAFRLSKFFGTTTEMWIDLQAHYDDWKINQSRNNIEVKPYKDNSGHPLVSED